nr:XRE family transcriptional regulator [Rhizobium sp. Q54]
MSDFSTETGAREDDTLGGRVSLARDAATLSVDEAAALLGVERETWAHWEGDRAAPRANRLGMLAGILQVSVGWLLSGRGRGPSYGV